MTKTRKLKSRKLKYRKTRKHKKTRKYRKIKNNSNKNYDFSKIHPASIMCR